MTPPEEEKPKPRRTRKKKDPAEAAAASTAGSPAAPDETAQEDEGTRGDAAADATTTSASEEPVSASSAEDVAATGETPADDEITPEPSDAEAEEAATDVVLEADAEAEGDESAVPDSDDGEAEEPEPPSRAPATRGSQAPQRSRTRGQRNAGGRDGGSEPAEPRVVRAQAKYVRSSARKARLVCDHIRGKSVDEARAILAHTPRAVAQDWSKLLESAVANAEHNHELVGEDLVIKAVKADEGPTIKRFRPRAMGRATRIRKRTSHLTILLTPKP
jgi:ribosomal protein L22